MEMTSDLIDTMTEEIIIGQIILDASVITKAARLIKPEHFGTTPCRKAYEAALTLWRAGTGVDLLTMCHQLRKDGSLDKHITPLQLSSFINRVSSPRHFEDHAQILREYAALRILRGVGVDLATKVKAGEDPAELIPNLSEAMGKATMADVDSDVRAGDHAAKIMNTNDRPKPIYLGIHGLDHMVFILPGNVVTIRAAAGVGKTALVLSAILNLIGEVKPWMVSLEMPADELVMRALCQIAMVDIDKALEGRLSDAERTAMATAAITHADVLNRLDIDDSGQMTVDEFMARAEHKVNVEGCRLIVIDYAQLMDGNGEREVEKLKSISLGVRATARKLSVPVLLIVHENRAGQDDGSSQFEKDAHVRLALAREQGSPTMTVNIEKNRNGRVGQVNTPCDMAHGIVGRNGPPHWAPGGGKRNEDEAPF